MLEAKLTPCATMLYHWILRQFPSADQIKIDLQDFQAWTGEYLENAYSDREIFDALQQLKQNHLITVARTEITLGVRLSDAKTVTPPPPIPMFPAEPNQIEAPVGVYGGDRLHPMQLISLVTLTSFIFGLIPILFGLAVSPSPDPTQNSGANLGLWPETVLGEKITDVSQP